MAGRVGYVPYAPTTTYESRDNISELILRAGEAAARGQARSGEIWGGAVQDLGSIGGQAIADYQAQRAAQEKARFEQQKKAAMGEFATATTRQGFDIQSALESLDPALRPEALDFFQKQEASKSEIAKRKAEMEKLQAEVDAEEGYRLADGANRYKQAMGTPYEAVARETLFGYFADEYPDKVEQFSQLPPEQLGPALDAMIGASPKFLEQQAKAEAEKAGIGFKQRELDLRAAENASQAAAREDARKLGWAQLAETQRGHNLSARQTAESSDQDAAFLLQGGTADKLPQAVRTTAVEAARRSGGIEGTGFVPTSQQQLTKYTDFNDLRQKATRLRELLTDKEVQAELGPMRGPLRSATKEWALVGASTKVKEAFDLMENLSDTELRKRSGAAISPGEYTRITGFTVAKNKQPDSNLVNLERMTGAIERAMRSMGATEVGIKTTPDGKRWYKDENGRIVEAK